MSDYVTIANMAAARIGTETRISSPDDDRFVARTIKAVWAPQRQAAIRDGAWNFATRRAELAAESDPDNVIYPWQYFFPQPADCLRFREVLNENIGKNDYQYENNGILANTLGPLYIKYSVDVEEPSLWDASFTDAFALRLAWRCGRRIAGSAFDQDLCWAEYRSAIAKAKGTDAKENPSIEQDDSSWIAARYARSAYGRWG